MTIIIPADAPAYGVFPALDSPDFGEGGGQGGGIDGDLYVIQPGDTLDVIAQELDVSLVSIMRANNITNSRAITPGMTIIIPADAPAYGVFPALDSPDFSTGGGQGGGIDGELYVIQPGDTLDVIAQELDVSLVSIMVANEITNSRAITPGMTIIIPADAPAYGLFPALDSPDFGEGGGQGGGVDGELYVIQRGDTLDVIAQEKNVSVVSIMMVNEITNGKSITPDMTILIPADAPPYGQFPAISGVDTSGGGGQGGGVDGELYVVQRGETIDGISARFNKLTSCVLEANGITNSRNVRAGLQIVLPSGCPAYAGAAIPGSTQPTGGSGGFPPPATDTTGEASG
jgi:LysM repeat protein